MTVPPSIDPARLLQEQLAQASPDLLRELMQSFLNTLMSTQADAVYGAGYGESSPERVNQRNGYRHRDFDTRAGTLDLAIPKLRHDSYSPDWLLEGRTRAEKALTSVVATGINADGHRETLGVQVTSSEDGAGWLAFFRDLTARGLSGVKLVTREARRAWPGGQTPAHASGPALLLALPNPRRQA